MICIVIEPNQISYHGCDILLTILSSMTQEAFVTNITKSTFIKNSANVTNGGAILSVVSVVNEQFMH